MISRHCGDIWENINYDLDLLGTILSLTKSGGGAVMSGEEIAACVQLAFGRAMELKPIMNP